MLLTRKNPIGGRRLTTFPIVEEPRTKQAGFKLGYCPCGEEIVCSIGDATEVAQNFGTSINEYRHLIDKVKANQVPKVPLSVRMAKWLVRDNPEYAEKLHTVEEDFRV
jgi:hypothetical protein